MGQDVLGWVVNKHLRVFLNANDFFSDVSKLQRSIWEVHGEFSENLWILKLSFLIQLWTLELLKPFNTVFHHVSSVPLYY